MIVLALLLAAAPVQEPRAVERYVDCVKAGMMKPEEEAETFDEAVDLAKSACGNLRPAAIDALKKGRAKELAKAGEDAEDAAQVLLDGMADGVAAKIWAPHKVGAGAAECRTKFQALLAGRADIHKRMAVAKKAASGDSLRDEANFRELMAEAEGNENRIVVLRRDCWENGHALD